MPGKQSGGDVIGNIRDALFEGDVVRPRKCQAPFVPCKSDGGHRAHDDMIEDFVGRMESCRTTLSSELWTSSLALYSMNPKS